MATEGHWQSSRTISPPGRTISCRNARSTKAVEDVAPIDEGGVGHEPLGRQPRQGDLRTLGQQCGDPLQTRRNDRIPSRVVERVLVRMMTTWVAPSVPDPCQNKGLQMARAELP